MNLEYTPMLRPSNEPDSETNDADEERPSKSRLMMFLQGATVFVVLFAILWKVLSRDS